MRNRYAVMGIITLIMLFARVHGQGNETGEKKTCFKGHTTIYVDKNNKDIYYFDLSFLES
ncbi:MAG: hypothetical protein GXO89_04590 [Chlorobi bacterium]|nr:hypothetical protein [Chlorobiota bacterium]